MGYIVFTLLQVFNLTNPAAVYKELESPLKFQTRCITCFPDSTGYLVGGRCCTCACITSLWMWCNTMWYAHNRCLVPKMALTRVGRRPAAELLNLLAAQCRWHPPLTCIAPDWPLFFVFYGKASKRLPHHLTFKHMPPLFFACSAWRRKGDPTILLWH